MTSPHYATYGRVLLFSGILVSGLIGLLIQLLFLHNLLTIMSASMKNEFLYSIAAVILQRSAPRSDFSLLSL